MHAPRSLEDLQKVARGLGFNFTIISAAMSGYVGWKFGGDSYYASIALCLLLAGLTIAVAIMMNFIDIAWSAGEKGVAYVLAGFLAVAAFGEFASHVAFGTGHRQHNIEQASLQTAKYSDTRDSVSEGKASLELWTSRLKMLEEQNAWAATTTADALRANVEAEERRGGCGQKCLALKAKLAIAEETTDLRKQIAATRKILDGAREKAASTEKGESIAANQSTLFATAATGSLAPSVQAIAWANIGIGTYIAFLSTTLGSVFNWLGFHVFGRRKSPVAELSAIDAGIGNVVAGQIAPRIERHEIREHDPRIDSLAQFVDAWRARAA